MNDVDSFILMDSMDANGSSALARSEVRVPSGAVNVVEQSVTTSAGAGFATSSATARVGHGSSTAEGMASADDATGEPPLVIVSFDVLAAPPGSEEEAPPEDLVASAGAVAVPAEWASAIDSDFLSLALRFYFAVLGREPDLEGLAHWVARLENGASPEEVAAAFVAGEEFSQVLAGDESDRAFVAAAYDLIFERDLDAEGEAHWTSALARDDFDRADMLLKMLYSDEGTARFLDDVEGILILA